jgi:cell division transport system permease protein
MLLALRKALCDMRNNRFLNAVTMITIALAVMIVAAFALVMINASDLLNNWRQGIRLMVYLKNEVSEARRLAIQYSLVQMTEVNEARFVSKDEAMERLRRHMDRHAGLLDGLDQNPLPAAYELQLRPGAESQIEALAERIAALDGVQEVAYGRQWLKRFAGLIELLRIVGYGLGGLFFLAAVFFVANTMRLVLYSRQEEVAIMRLVGATEGFIRAPFYLEALLQGAIGGLAGLGVLYLVYLAAAGNVGASLGGFGFSFRFLPWTGGVTAVACAMFVGWLGCFASLKQFIGSF